MVVGQDAFVKSVLATQGEAGWLLAEKIGGVFGKIGAALTIAEQTFEMVDDLNSGASLGSTLIGGAVNTSTILSFVEGGAEVGGYFGSFAPGPGNLFGSLLGGAGGAIVGLVLPHPAATGRFFLQAQDQALWLQTFNARNGISTIPYGW